MMGEFFSHLLSVNDSCGNTITLTYANTSNHVLQRITDGAGRVTALTYTDLSYVKGAALLWYCLFA